MKYPKTFQRVPFDTSTRTRMNTILSAVTFPSKIREFGESRSIHMDFSFESLVPVSLKRFFFFQNVSVNAVMAQTFLPGVHDIEVLDL